MEVDRPNPKTLRLGFRIAMGLECPKPYTLHPPWKPVINKQRPLNRDYNKDPYKLRPLKGRGLFIRGLH